MRSTMKWSANNPLELGLPENRLGLKPVNWVGRLIEPSSPMMVALERTWYSLKVLVAGMPAGSDVKPAAQRSALEK